MELSGNALPMPNGVGSPLRRILGFLSANMNTLADQPITIVCPTPQYVLRGIIAYNQAAGSLALAVGGIYTGAGKTGSAIIAAAQVYSGLTGPTKFIDLPLASLALTDYMTANPLYFALTTAAGAAATASILVYGDLIP